MEALVSDRVDEYDVPVCDDKFAWSNCSNLYFICIEAATFLFAILFADSIFENGKVSGNFTEVSFFRVPVPRRR